MRGAHWVRRERKPRSNVGRSREPGGPCRERCCETEENQIAETASNGNRITLEFGTTRESGGGFVGVEARFPGATSDSRGWGQGRSVGAQVTVLLQLCADQVSNTAVL